MFRQIETFWHATFASNAGAKRHTAQLPFQIICPLVVDALQAPRIAASFAAYECAAMSATVLHDIDVAVVVPRDEHGCLADESRLIVTAVW